MFQVYHVSGGWTFSMSKWWIDLMMHWSGTDWIGWNIGTRKIHREKKRWNPRAGGSTEIENRILYQFLFLIISIHHVFVCCSKDGDMFSFGWGFDGGKNPDTNFIPRHHRGEGGACFELLHNSDDIEIIWPQQIKMCTWDEISSSLHIVVDHDDNENDERRTKRWWST